MAFLSVEKQTVEMLDRGWTLAVAEAGACSTPRDLMLLTEWFDAAVPGTAAGALTRAGSFCPEAPAALHDKDVWYRRTLKAQGHRVLRFDGLATLCEIYLDDALILSSDNMFCSSQVEVELRGEHRLHLAFRALEPALSKHGPRARWRTHMIPNQALRHVRTTLLGHMPGWTPPIDAVGPWRPIRLITPTTVDITQPRISARIDQERGRLTVKARLRGVENAFVVCEGRRSKMWAKNDLYEGELLIENVRAWSPHTHGAPHLYPIAIEADGQSIDLGKTGFRTIEIDRGVDGKDFALRLNGEKIFCRGAVWTNANIVDLPGDRASYEPWLRRARDAQMNMICISGVTTYESRAFFELCDELGLMVWADFMFGNFDYPIADADFAASCQREAETFLNSVEGCPSLAILCGGSEMKQQAAMMGLPATRWGSPLTDRFLPDVAEGWRPDVPYVDNSPSGGPLPFATNEGVTHYYGVGAYMRPLEDARRADVRFAAECLAFANVPQELFLDRFLASVPAHDPRWKAAVPRDLAASWDFEDVREFYLKTLYDVDPARLRRENSALWRDASRAVSCEVMEATFAEWRRAGSGCNGALVWTLQDLVPGAGWGILDSSGEPKPVYYALKRAFRPRQILLTDEGANGLLIHVLNENAAPFHAKVELSFWRDDGQEVLRKTQNVELAPREKRSLSATSLIGSFFDFDLCVPLRPLELRCLRRTPV